MLFFLATMFFIQMTECSQSVEQHNVYPRTGMQKNICCDFK